MLCNSAVASPGFHYNEIGHLIKKLAGESIVRHCFDNAFYGYNKIPSNFFQEIFASFDVFNLQLKHLFSLHPLRFESKRITVSIDERRDSELPSMIARSRCSEQ